jgi:hypothetical protein
MMTAAARCSAASSSASALISRALFAQRVGRLSHGASHAGWDLDAFHVDEFDLHAPRFGHVVDLVRHVGCNGVLRLQDFVKRMPTQYAAPGRRRDTAFETCLTWITARFRIDDQLPNHGIDLDSARCRA